MKIGCKKKRTDLSGLPKDILINSVSTELKHHNNNNNNNNNNNKFISPTVHNALRIILLKSIYKSCYKIHLQNLFIINYIEITI